MKTSLGDDALLLDSFHGRERVTAHSEVIPQRLPPRMPKTATDMTGYRAAAGRLLDPDCRVGADRGSLVNAGDKSGELTNGGRWMLFCQVSTTADSVLPNWSLRLISELDAADRRAESVAKGLSAVQLNWQPRQGAWSVGQCLEHLRIANEVLLPVISVALEGRQCRTVDEISLGWFSRWFIRTYIAPNPGGIRARAPKKIEPARK